MATPNLSEIATTAIENRSRKLADNITENTALLYKMKQRGKVKPVDGGESILQELFFQENQTYKRYQGYERLDIRPSEVITAAKFPWKEVAVAVTISGLEEIKNGGRSRQIDLLASRITAAEATMMNGLSNDLYSDGTADSGKQINGLQQLVANSPNTGTVGGIDRASWSFWRNQVRADASYTADNIKGRMQQLWVACVRNRDMPDLITFDNNFYRLYWESLQDQQRFTHTDMAKGGWNNLMFNSAPVVLDGGIGGSAPANSGYFLNCMYIHWRPHTRWNMRPLSADRHSIDQDAIVKIIKWAGNLTLSNASLQGRIRQT